VTPLTDGLVVALSGAAVLLAGYLVGEARNALHRRR
jgi:hypothetical protein